MKKCIQLCWWMLSLLIGVELVAQNTNPEGVWIGYIMDLGQVSKGQLPKVYSVQIVLVKKKGNKVEGIISKYWEQNYHTISSIAGSSNDSTKSYNLVEKDLIQYASDINYPSCKMITTLKQVDIGGKTILQGRYYGIEMGNSANVFCPVGLIHLERPKNETPYYKNLISYLDNNNGISPKQKNKEQVEQLAFSFPKITISTIPFYTLQNTLKYDIYKLAKFQKTGALQQALWKKEHLKMIIQSVGYRSDTVNVMLDGVIMASNHRLSSRSPISINMEFEVNRALHKLSIIPFSMTEKDTQLKVLLFSDDGELHNSYNMKYKSNQNAEIDITIDIPPKEKR